jgi:hypothetical protein
MKLKILKDLKLMDENDWIDELLEDEPSSLWQIGKIESLLVTSSANYLYENIDLNELTYYEAEEIIKDLWQNDCPRDPRDQFERMRRRGMFK